MTVRPLQASPCFKDILPVIKNIRTTFNAPSISCGVLHHGEIIFLHGEGLADVKKKLSPDADTVYCVASCSKAFTAATCGILVDEGKLSWTEPVNTYLPDFETVHDREVGRRATLLDLCSHGSGLAPLDRAVAGFFDEFYQSGTDQVKIAAQLPVCYDLRSRFLYNNTILGLVGDVIAKVCGQTSGTVLEEKILKPLGMSRSCTKSSDLPADGNFARGYAILDGGSPHPFDLPAIDDGCVSAAAGYVRSSVRDMLVWAKAVMEAEAEAEDDRSRAFVQRRNPLRQMQIIRSAHRPITLEGKGYENSYGLGWFRHMLPSSWLSSIGPNFALLPDPPVMNRAGPPRLTIAHWGEFQGFLSAFYTFPDTCSAVIVLANCSPGRGDPADLVAQSLCQRLFNMKPHVDFESYAVTAVNASRLLWPALVEEWVSNRVQGTKPGPLEDYIGKYVNGDLKLTIDVYQTCQADVGPGPNPKLLSFTVNSIQRQTAKLRHYHYDTWSFLPDSRDDAIKQGMEAYMILPRLLLSFIRDKAGYTAAMEWDLQAGECEGPAPSLDKKVAPVRFVRVSE